MKDFATEALFGDHIVCTAPKDFYDVPAHFLDEDYFIAARAMEDFPSIYDSYDTMIALLYIDDWFAERAFAGCCVEIFKCFIGVMDKHYMFECMFGLYHAIECRGDEKIGELLRSMEAPKVLHVLARITILISMAVQEYGEMNRQTSDHIDSLRAWVGMQASLAMRSESN